MMKTVDGYIAAITDPAARAALTRLRATVSKLLLPDCEECISYQIPAYRLAGRGGGMVLFFAAWKEHYSLYPATAGVKAALEKELAPYELSKGTIRFPLGKPVPVRLIGRIARLRLAEAQELKAAKAVAKKKKKTTR